ncbi:MAG: prepilin-type N-terminal cleavage/methylation domain-containing protein [Armatimonadota bacterium]|nr:prepilin-type N-terminal cleavage/methylation domain-containing protein [Armatimonadota bacterium]MDR7551045.1 prepilin-type N-terminal cleavage/methylation domain-containing protein [Armatimonadota bacterium]
MISKRSISSFSTRLRETRGVSLLELVIAMSLLALAVGSIYAFVATGARSARVTNEFVQTQSQVRAALDALIDEMRWAQTVVAASATQVTLFVPQATPFSAASPYTVTFAYDAATDTITRQEDPDAGGPLPAGPPAPLASLVVRPDGGDGLALEYFDAAGSSLGSAPVDLPSIVRIRITVTTASGGVSRVFAGDVALRGR